MGAGLQNSRSVPYRSGRSAVAVGRAPPVLRPFGRWSQGAGAGQRFNAGARFSLLGQSAPGAHSHATGHAESPRFILHLYGEHASSPPEPRNAASA